MHAWRAGLLGKIGLYGTRRRLRLAGGGDWDQENQRTAPRVVWLAGGRSGYLSV
jgi:hypothetical protein